MNFVRHLDFESRFLRCPAIHEETRDVAKIHHIQRSTLERIPRDPRAALVVRELDLSGVLNRAVAECHSNSLRKHAK